MIESQGVPSSPVPGTIFHNFQTLLDFRDRACERQSIVQSYRNLVRCTRYWDISLSLHHRYLFQPEQRLNLNWILSFCSSISPEAILLIEERSNLVQIGCLARKTRIGGTNINWEIWRYELIEEKRTGSIPCNLEYIWDRPLVRRKKELRQLTLQVIRIDKGKKKISLTL